MLLKCITKAKQKKLKERKIENQSLLKDIGELPFYSWGIYSFSSF